MHLSQCGVTECQRRQAPQGLEGEGSERRHRIYMLGQAVAAQAKGQRTTDTPVSGSPSEAPKICPFLHPLQGFQRVYDELGDLSLDVPLAQTILEHLVDLCFEEGVITKQLRDACPPRYSPGVSLSRPCPHDLCLQLKRSSSLFSKRGSGIYGAVLSNV